MSKSAETIIKELAAPFPAKHIHFRVGARTKDKTKGIPLAYIDARDAMERLDAVVGPANWQRRYPWSDGGRLYCEVGIRLDGEWIWKGDGAGDTQVEAEKGAFSDAFKRACVNWGVAQYLYDVPNSWMELNDYGNGFKDVKEIRRRFEAWQAAYFKRASESEQAEVFGNDSGARDKMVADVVAAIGADDPETFLVTIKADEDLWKSVFSRTLNTKQKSAARDLEQRGFAMAVEYAEGIKQAAEKDDGPGLSELVDELSTGFKKIVWAQLDAQTKAKVKAMKEQS